MFWRRFIITHNNINKAIETIRNNNTRKYIRILAEENDNLDVCWLNLYNILADYTYVMFFVDWVYTIFMLTEIMPQIDFKDVVFPDFDSFRHKKILMRSVAIAFHQDEIGIISLYIFFHFKNISFYSFLQKYLYQDSLLIPHPLYNNFLIFLPNVNKPLPLSITLELVSLIISNY